MHSFRFHTTLHWHQRLTRFKPYKRWHDFRYSHHIHVATAVATLLVTILANLLPGITPTDVLAANGSWSQTTFNGTDDGTYTNTGIELTLPPDTVDNGNGTWTATLQPNGTIGEDTRLQAYYPNNTDGANATMYVGYIGAGDQYPGLIRFTELGNIPAGSTISSVQMELYEAGLAPVTTGSVYVHKVLKDWTEATATWNNYTTGSAWQTAGCLGATDRNATASTSFTINTTINHWHTITSTANLVSDVQSWVDGTTNNGWKLYISQSNLYTAFASSDNATAANRPKLTVTYTPPTIGEVNLSHVSSLSNDGGGAWKYRRPITITNSSGGTLTNYQVKVNLATADLGNPYTHINNDGSDIRFTNAAGDTEYSYFIEKWSATGDSIVWVKIPSLGTGDTDINMYYGNWDATSSSSGDDTFVFFDDFEDGSISASKWDSGGASGTWTESSGQLHGSAAPTQGYLWNKTAIPANHRIVTRGKSSANYPTAVWVLGSGSGDPYSDSPRTGFYIDALADFYRLYHDAAWDTEAQAFDAATWYVAEGLVDGLDYTLKGYDSSYSAMANPDYSATITSKPSGNKLAFRPYNETTDYEYIFVGEYTTSDPTHGAPGAEESVYVTSGTYASEAIPSDVDHQDKVYEYGDLTFSNTLNGQTITYDVLDADSGNPIGGYTGITSSPTDLSGISASTYPSLKVRANMSGSGTATPTLDEWAVAYSYDVTDPSTPTSLTIGTVAATSVDLSWTGSTDTESGIAGYEVQHAPDSGGSPGSWAAAGGTCAGTVAGTSCSDTGLSANTKYYFRVRAKDNSGNYSVYTGRITPNGDTLGLWYLDEGSGGTSTDSSGNGGTITFGGSGYWSNAGKFGSAFNGTGSTYGTIPHSATLEPTDFTIDTWINPVSSSQPGMVLLKHDNYQGTARGYYLRFNSGGSVSAAFGNSGDAWANSYVLTADPITADGNTWTHIAVTFKNSASPKEMKIYVNGNLSNSSTTTYPILYSQKSIQFGRAMKNSGTLPDDYFTGKIDETRVTNAVLTEPELQAYYAEAGPNPKSTTTLSNAPVLDTPTSPANDTTPAITNASNPDASFANNTIHLYVDGGDSNVTTTADGSGEFTFDNADYAGVPYEFTYGEHTIYVTAENDESQESAASATENMNIDTEDPTAPTASSAWTDGGKTSEITDNGWSGNNNTDSVYFEWSGADDPIPGGESWASGIKRYHVYFGSNGSATPSIDGTPTADATASATRTLSSPTSGTDYYMRIQTEDNAGNLSTASTLFTYKFDDTDPNPVDYAVANPGGWSAADPYYFSWPAATDAHSDVAGYEYKRDNGTDDWTFTADLNVSGINHYQNGVNKFLLRTKDNAGNVSTTVTTNYYYSGTVASPENLQVDLSQSVGQTVNMFKFTWDPPVGVTTVGYYYSVNASPTTENTTYTTDDFTGFDSFATQQGLNTFYVVAKDDFDNVGWTTPASVNFSINTVAPDVPQNVTITDASNRSTSNWALTVAWDALASPTPDFDGYEIWRCTANCDNDANFNDKRGTVSTNIFSEAGLSNVTDYYYKIKSKDNVGNTSGFSDAVDKTPTGKYTTPPTYTSTPDVDAKALSATVSWTTNRASNTIVKYDTGSITAASPEVSKSTEAVTDHSIEIQGLQPGTKYNFKVQSLDADRDYAPSLAYSAQYDFTTLPAPGISDVNISEIRLDSAIVTWKTTSSATSKILYGKTTSYGSTYTDSSASATTTHTVKLTSLSDSTTYNFKIQGTDVDGNTLNSDNYVFTTLTFPRLSDLKIEQVKNSPTSTIKVSFSSNVPTSTLVTVSGNGGKDAAKYELETSHEVVIAGLLDNTAYTVAAKGRDAYGNETASLSESYKTEFDTRPPEISNITTETSIVGTGVDAKGQIVISWVTDEAATSQVEYGPGATGSEYTAKTQEDTSLVENHVVIISDLKTSSPYHFRIISRDNAENIGTSGENSALTDQAVESIIDLIIKSLQNTIGWIFNVFNR